MSNNLPHGWTTATIEDAVDILDSKRVPINAKDRAKRVDGKRASDLFPYYGATGQVGWIDDFLFDENLVLIGEDGAPFFDFTKSIAYIIKGKTWVNNHAHVLRAIAELTSDKYIAHYLNQFNFHGYVSGTTRLKLNQAPMRRIPLPIAPLNEQKRIVAKIEQLFSDLDAGVETLQALKKQIKQYRQSVLKYAFEGKLTAEWRKKNKPEPASKLLEKIAKEKEQKSKGKKQKKLSPLDMTDLPNLPEGWKWTHLGNIIDEPKYGTSKKCSYESQGMGVLRIPNIVNGMVDDGDLKFAEFDEKEKQVYSLTKGDLLTIRSNGSVSLVGRCAMVSDVDEKHLFAGYLIRLRPTSTEIISKYMLYAMRSSFLRNQIESKAKSTSGVNNINSNEIKSLVVPLCDSKEQEQTVLEIERHFSIAEKAEEVVETALKQSSRLRQSILKRAFEGKLVSQDPTDEPAEKLLERIKESEVIKAEGKKR